MKVVKIVPRNKLPRNQRDYFDYKADDFKNLSRGDIVSIEFRKKKISGIVWDIRDKDEEKRSFPLKPLLGVEPEMRFPFETLSLMAWMGSYYVSSLPALLRLFLPVFPKRDTNFSQKHPFIGCIGSKYRELSLRKQDMCAMRDFINSKERTNLFIGKELKVKMILYIKHIEACMAQNKSVLFLVPQVSDVKTVLSFFPAEWENKIAVFGKSEGMLPRVLLQNWKSVVRGTAHIILGTRNACFAPMKNIGLIIMHNEHADEYKQWDQNPRYDARNIVNQFLVIFPDARVLLTSPAPTLPAYTEHTERALVWSDRKGVSLTSVDMAKEIQNKNLSGISYALENQIARALKANKRVLLYLNRRGFSRKVICKSCGFLFKCGRCLLPYQTEQGDSISLVCSSCSARADMPSICPECGLTTIKSVGIGIQKIASVLKRLFQDTMIAVVAEGALPSEKASLVIGTRGVLLLRLDRVGAVAVLNADEDLYVPDFRAHERAFRTILLAHECALENQHGDEEVACIVQTENEAHPAISLAVNGKVKQYFSRELDLRRSLGYPPFSSLISLICQGSGEALVQTSVEELYQKLCIFKSAFLTIFPPEQVVHKRASEMYRFHIVVKILKGRDLPPDFVRVLKSLPSSWIIDRDPLRLV